MAKVAEGPSLGRGSESDMQLTHSGVSSWPEFLIVIVVVLIVVRLIFKLAATALLLILVVAAGLWAIGVLTIH